MKYITDQADSREIRSLEDGSVLTSSQKIFEQKRLTKFLITSITSIYKAFAPNADWTEEYKDSCKKFYEDFRASWWGNDNNYSPFTDEEKALKNIILKFNNNFEHLKDQPFFRKFQ